MKAEMTWKRKAGMENIRCHLFPGGPPARPANGSGLGANQHILKIIIK